jgi:DnaJ-class molecular chaperone
MRKIKIIDTQNKVYNEFRRAYIGNEDLKEGETFCDKCGGTGVTPFKGPEYLQEYCDKCRGQGVLDWIEKVVGKAPIPSELHGTSFCFHGTSGYGAGKSGASRVTNI